MSFYTKIYDTVSDFILAGNPRDSLVVEDKSIYEEVWRILGYRQYWASWQNLKNYVRKPTASSAVQINIPRAFVDKSVDFLVGKPFSVMADKKYSEIVNPVLKYIRSKGGVDLSHLEIVTAGGIAGDAMIKVLWDAQLQAPRFQVLSPENVFLEYATFDKSRTNLTKAVICYQGWYDWDGKKDKQWVLFKEEWTNTTVKKGIEYKREIEKPGTQGTFNKYFNAFTGALPGTYYEPTTTELIEENLGEKENDLGFIPIIHFRNLLNPLSNYGRSDLEDVAQINVSLNETINTYKASTDYAGNPVTIIQGEKAGGHRRDVNKIWSGFKKDSKIFNLGGNDSFPAVKEFMDRLLDYAYMVGSIPEAYSGLFQNISNTTGVALQVQYLPLIGLTNRKRLSYGAAFSQAYEYALRLTDKHLNLNLQENIDNYLEAHEIALKDLKNSDEEENIYIAKRDEILDQDLKSLPIKKYYEVSIKWGDFLPKDSLLELDQIERELEKKLESRRGAMEKRGVDNPDEKMEEIRLEDEKFGYNAEDEDFEEDGIFGEEGQGKDKPGNKAKEGSEGSQDRKEVNEKKSDEQNDPTIKAGKQKRGK